MPKLILASSSPYRRQLLEKLQLPFTYQSPDVDETALANETPQALVQRLSISKAKSVAAKQEQASLVIGSDQVAVLGDKILGKPLNHANAVRQLSECSNQTVQFLTGLCLYNNVSQTTHYSTEIFQVRFRALSKQQIENYLNKDQPYDCAGSFKAESLGISLFSQMQGNDPNILLGLPLIRLIDFLQQEGVSPL